MKRALITAFCAVFFGAQIAMVAWSYVRKDRLFGYQMFAESTFFRAQLHRVLRDGTRVHAVGGSWTARGADGQRRTHSWHTRVRDFRLDHLDQSRPTRAKIGIEVTLKFFQMALDDLATHARDDVETRRFEIDVEYTLASGVKKTVTLSSRDRP